VAFRFLTSRESHGECLAAVIDGSPPGLALARQHLDEDLARRQRGYRRGGRVKIERGDHADLSAGVRRGVTLGSPLTCTIHLQSPKTW